MENSCHMINDCLSWRHDSVTSYLCSWLVHFRNTLLCWWTDSLTLAQRKYSDLCRRAHLVLIRIRSKRFEQRQRYRQLGVQRAVLQRTDSRPDVVFLGLVEVVNVGRTTAGHRTGTCSSHLLTDSSREGLLGKITTWRTIMLGLSSVTSLHINVTDKNSVNV